MTRKGNVYIQHQLYSASKIIYSHILWVKTSDKIEDACETVLIGYVIPCINCRGNYLLGFCDQSINLSTITSLFSENAHMFVKMPNQDHTNTRESM